MENFLKKINLLKYGMLPKKYFSIVEQHITELKSNYPFVKSIELKNQSLISLEVIAVNKKIIDITNANENDLCGEYSKKVIVIIPLDYPNCHCKIYGAKWLDTSKISNNDKHFYPGCDLGLDFCVGVPNSVKNLSNVLLENIRTIEVMLIAYEKLQKGESKKLELKSYSHGKDGENEYEKDKEKYISKNKSR